MAISTELDGPSVRSSDTTRWGQLIFGIICMVMIANLQYGWTLFVNPIDQKYHWGRAAIQVAFTLFVLTETWLVPFEGYLIDKFGPRVMIGVSGVLVAIAWVINSMADFAVPALCRRGHRRHRRRRDLWRLGRQRAQVVPGSARSRGRTYCGGVRRRFRAHRDPDRQHDRVEWLSIRIPVVRPRPGHRRCCRGIAAARAAGGRGSERPQCRLVSRPAATSCRRSFEDDAILDHVRHVRHGGRWRSDGGGAARTDCQGLQGRHHSGDDPRA